MTQPELSSISKRSITLLKRPQTTYITMAESQALKAWCANKATATLAPSQLQWVQTIKLLMGLGKKQSGANVTGSCTFCARCCQVLVS